MKIQESFLDLSANLIQFLTDHKDKTTDSASERVLQNFTKAHFGHDDYDAVSIKATLLNMFYATGIQAIELMAQNIYSIENIDEILAQEKCSTDLINRIALLKFGEGKKDRNNYSFATKYCALHQPAKYPIYDSIVANCLTKLMTEGGLLPYTQKKKYSEPSSLTCMTQSEFQEALRNYDFFVRVYDQFMELYGLKKAGITYRDVDWYIWASYKIKGNDSSKLEKLIPKLPRVHEWEDTDKDIKRTKLAQKASPSDKELLKVLQEKWNNT